MHTGDGFKVLERNSRGGNTEQISVLSTIEDDFVDVCFRMLEGSLKGHKVLEEGRGRHVRCPAGLRHPGDAPLGEGRGSTSPQPTRSSGAAKGLASIPWTSGSRTARHTWAGLAPWPWSGRVHHDRGGEGDLARRRRRAAGPGPHKEGHRRSPRPEEECRAHGGAEAPPRRVRPSGLRPVVRQS